MFRKTKEILSETNKKIRGHIANLFPLLQGLTDGELEEVEHLFGAALERAKTKNSYLNSNR